MMTGLHDLQPPLAEVPWNQLRKYLETHIELGESLLARPNPGSRRQTRVVPVSIRVENTAPSGPDEPLVVFTGISLSFLRRQNAHSLTIDLESWSKPSNVTLKQNKEQPSKQPQVITGTTFPRTTPAEESRGIILFPGESASYELFIPERATNLLDFVIDATLSSRHLLHYRETLQMVP